MATNQHIPAEQLEADIRAGTIDTVVVAFSDHQGRLVGKRTDGDFYLDVVADEGTENCDYLIACDLDDTPITGFRWASYEQGYGDMRGVVDPSTIRYLPWLDATALVLVDLVDVDTGEPVDVSPRRIRERDAGSDGVASMPLDDPEDREAVRDRRRGVKAGDRRCHALERSRLHERCRVGLDALDELGDEGADTGQHADHGRPDAELGGDACRSDLPRPIDAQQFGPLARDAGDEPPAVDVDAEVAVRDARGDGCDERVGPLPSRHLPDEGHDVAFEHGGRR